jgi:parvulin-like peptidyl-prolyl isomerase
MRVPVRAAAVAALVLVGCGCRREPPPAPATPAVATFDGGSVTAAEVDRAVLDLPAGQRQPADGDLLRWYERIARDLAMQELLLAEARAAGLDRGPEFEQARAEAVRQGAVAVFLEKKLAGLPAPTTEEVEAYYRDRAKDFRSPEARQTYHIFRRVAPGADPAPAVAEMRRLRERVAAGEDFATLASQLSDSESRHQKGLLGWVAPGKVAPDLERVVFALSPRVPSQPLKTATGVHLFLVSEVAPAKTLTLSEVRNAIALLLAAERNKAAVEKLLAGAAIPGSFLPTAEELRALFETRNPSAVVLRAGDFQLTAAQLQARIVAGQSAPFVGGPDSPAHALLSTLEQRERAYRLAVKEGLDRSPEVAAGVQRQLDRELAALRLRQRLAERVDRDPQRLRAYYEANRARFSTPLTLKVERLAVPIAGNANQVMARMERARADLESGRLAFSTLAAELGGTLREPAWELPTQIAQRERRPVAAADAKVGRYSAPYRTVDQIEMARVVERREPQVPPLDGIREQVRTDLLVTHRQDEYAALVEEMLGSRHFATVPRELEAMLTRPTASGR